MQMVKTVLRAMLALALVFAGTSHLTSARETFRAQVPTWLPLDADFVVISSGFVEIGLGLSLLLLARFRWQVGLLTAMFFIAIFPGNVSQWVNGIAAFGLDTDQARFIRLFFQPVLVIWAIWSTGAWRGFSDWLRHRTTR